MSTRLVCAIVLSVLHPAIGMAAGHAPSLCSSEETIVMSCRSGSKLASVCSSRAASGELLYAQYRFGRPGHSELAIPPRSPFDISLLRGETTTGTHGSWAGLSVRNGDVVYTVEHTLDMGLDADEIIVSKGGQRLTTIDCKPALTSEGLDISDLRGFITANHLQPPEPGTVGQ